MRHRDSSVSVLVPMHSRRRQRAQFAQKLQHLAPAVALLFTAFQGIRAGEVHGLPLVITAAEIVTSVVLIAIAGRTFRRLASRQPHGHGHHAGTDWFDVWAAGVLFAEAGEKWIVSHHISGPTILTGVATLALGLAHGRIVTPRERRRALRMTDEELIVGGRPFRRFTVRWNQIKSITINDREAEILTRDGRAKKVDFDDLENAAEVRAALSTAQARLPAVSP
jgi:hypothetical protein